MQLSDKIKKFSAEQAVDYLNKNPVKNLPKLLDWADTFCKGEFENQRRTIRKACMDPNDAHYPMVQHMLNDIDPEVLKTTLVKSGVRASTTPRMMFTMPITVPADDPSSW